MASGDEPEVYCAWERKRFPASRFEPREGHGLVHVKGVTEPHTTSGLPLEDGGGWSAPADVAPDR